MWTVFSQADMKFSRVSLRRIRAMAKAPATPTAPPSVGLKTPMRMPAQDEDEQEEHADDALERLELLLKGDRLAPGARSGRTTPMSHRQRIKDRASKIPGTIPAIKSLPTDSSVTMA